MEQETLLRLGAAPPSCRAKDLLTPPADAERVAVCDELTVETAAEKEALLAPEGTVTLEGTVTAALLLDSATVRPVLLAALLSETVQESVPAAV